MTAARFGTGPLLTAASLGEDLSVANKKVVRFVDEHGTAGAGRSCPGAVPVLAREAGGDQQRRCRPRCPASRGQALPTKIPSPRHRANGPDRRRGDAAPSGSLPPPIPTLPTPALLDAAAVAARLDVSLRTVRRLIAAGELPVHRIGRAVRVSEDDLARFLAARRQA